MPQWARSGSSPVLIRGSASTVSRPPRSRYCLMLSTSAGWSDLFGPAITTLAASAGMGSPLRSLADLVIAGPKRSLQPAEVESIKQYLDRGGRLTVLADPLINTGLEPLLAHWGITLGPGVVVDQEGRTFGGSYTLPLVTTYSVHQIVRELKLPTLFPEARPLLLNVNTPTAGLNALAQTSGQSWAELDVAVRPPQYDAHRQKRGPLVLEAAG